MKSLRLIIGLVVISTLLHGQDITVTEGLQKISNGALWYEYRQHSNPHMIPTIVLEAGALSHANYWDPIIDSIAKFTNTIRYDRAGLGNSNAPADSIRSAVQIAKELNELLDSLTIKNKIILVCHSAGGFYGRTFAHLFENKITALVLIESPCITWEDQIRSSLTKRQNLARDSLLEQNRRGLSLFARNEYAASEMNRKFIQGIPQFQIPVFVLYGRDHRWPQDYDRNTLEAQWRDCQTNLARISTNSQTIPISEAGHHIFSVFDLPKFLFEALSDLQ